MTTINLKDFYAWYTHDEYIEVSDEVAACYIQIMLQSLCGNRLDEYRCQNTLAFSAA